MNPLIALSDILFSKRSTSSSLFVIWSFSSEGIGRSKGSNAIILSAKILYNLPSSSFFIFSVTWSSFSSACWSGSSSSSANSSYFDFSTLLILFYNSCSNYFFNVSLTCTISKSSSFVLTRVTTGWMASIICNRSASQICSISLIYSRGPFPLASVTKRLVIGTRKRTVFDLRKSSFVTNMFTSSIKSVPVSYVPAIST